MYLCYTQEVVNPVCLFTISELSKDISWQVVNILDIWCWGGSFYTDWIYLCMELRNKIQYTWVDISKTSFRNIFLSFISNNFKIKKYDAQKKLPFHEEEFDILLAKMVLHNFDDLDNHFKEANRILQVGGKYFIILLSDEYILDKIWRNIYHEKFLITLYEKPIWAFDIVFIHINVL